MGESTRPGTADLAAARIAVLGPVRNREALDAATRVLAEAGFGVELVESLSPRDAVGFDLILHDPDPAPEALSIEDVHIGRLHIDGARKRVFVDRLPVPMSAREYALLRELAAHPDVVFSRAELLRSVWGSTWRTEGSVTEYIRRLRILLEPTGIGECIATRKGFGYSFDPEPAMAGG